MENICVIAADAARARLFRLVRRPGQGGHPAPALEELQDLVNPAARLRTSEIQGDTRPGSRQGAPGGPGHAVDDHRDAYVDEMARRFAAEIADAVATMRERIAPQVVVLAAPPGLLGHLRRHRAQLVAGDAKLVEIAKDVSRLTAPELQDYLANAGAVPSRKVS